MPHRAPASQDARAPFHGASPRAQTHAPIVLAAAAVIACLLGAFWNTWWVVALPLCATSAILGVAGRHRGVGVKSTLLTDRDALEDLSEATHRVLPHPGRARSPHAVASLGQVASEAREALSLLADERDTLRKVLDSVGEPILVTDPRGAVRHWNHAAEVFLGRGPDRLAGRLIDELFTTADLVAIHARASRGEPAHATVRIARTSGVRSYEVSATPVEWNLSLLDPGDTVGPGASAAVVTLRDITELASASQVQTDFVANASHELRTPLSSIRGAVETLLDDSGDPVLRGRLLRMIASNVGRLEELIRDLLDLSRLDAPDAGRDRTPIALPSLLASLEADFASACESRSLELRIDLDPRMHTIRADPRLVDLILRNLIENAVKFANEGTTVRVVAETVDPRGGGSALWDARLSVIDRGQGIPLAAQPRIFERFYQADPSRSGGTRSRGTGLGLAIVKHAVDALGGTIRLDSVWMQGTTMIVDLPSCVPAPGSRPAAGNAA